MSIGVFVQKSDYEVSIKGQTLSLSKTNELENIEFKSEGKELLYYFEGTRDLGTIETVMTSTTTTQPPVIIPTKQIKIDINEAHDKFGHIGEVALRATLKTLNIEVTGSLTPCEGCAFAKARLRPKQYQSSLQQEQLMQVSVCVLTSAGPIKSLSLEAIIGSLL